MTKYTFEEEYATDVFINGNNGISIVQRDGMGNEEIVVFQSKLRAVRVAKALLALSKITDFTTREEPEQ